MFRHLLNLALVAVPLAGIGCQSLFWERPRYRDVAPEVVYRVQQAPTPAGSPAPVPAAAIPPAPAPVPQLAPVPAPEASKTAPVTIRPEPLAMPIPFTPVTLDDVIKRLDKLASLLEKKPVATPMPKPED